MIIQQITPHALSNMTRTQKIANKVGSFIPKRVSNFFEMDQMGTLSRIPLLMIALVFVLGARFIKSRDEHERREVLTRDGVTVSAAMVSVPILKNWVQRGIDKITKIPVATEKNKIFALSDFGFDNIKNWYSKAEFNPEKAHGVAKTIKERGGDVAKAFLKLGDEGVNSIKTMLNGKEYNSSNIMEALENTFKSGNTEAKSAFENLTKLLSKDDNGLVKSAQIYKAIPNALSLVGITALLGYGIPAFNIHLTRKILKGGNNHDKQNSHTNALEPNLSANQEKVIASFYKKTV